MDIHPSATLIGDGSECQPVQWAKALARARVQPGNRSLRLKVQGSRGGNGRDGGRKTDSDAELFAHPRSLCDRSTA
jgi:hypothetical protein